MKANNFDLIIIGAGPAGLSSAIYASRAGLKTLIIDKGAPGGKLNNTHRVDNYPGMEGISGFKMASSFLEQAKNFGVKLIGGEVIKLVDLDKKIKTVVLKHDKKFSTKAVIIASGVKAKKLNIPGYDKYFGKGVSTCVVCDGAFYKNKSIAIIGSGNSATEESIYASKIVKDITIISISDKFNAEQVTIDKIKKIKNIKPIFNSQITSINGDDNKLSSITIKNKDGEKTINVSGVFTYIGWDPENNFMDGWGLTDKKGFVSKYDNNFETKYKGVYVIGDILNKKYKQITTSVSDGTVASLAAEKYISES